MFTLSDLGFAWLSFRLAPTSGSCNSPWILYFELSGYNIVCCIITVCVMFALSDLGLAMGSAGLAPTCGSGQLPEIGSLELVGCITVCFLSTVC